MVEIGTKIKELREAKKMTQKDLAEHLNVTPQAVSKWERNKSYPDLDTLLKLSQYFQISTDKLLGNSKPSFLALLFAKQGGAKQMNKQSEANKTYPAGTVPKAVKVENLATFLRVTFDNGETRYLRTRLNEDIVQHPFTRKKENGKRSVFFAGARQQWIGSDFEIKANGEVVMNGTDSYSSEELWYDSKSQIHEL